MDLRNHNTILFKNNKVYYCNFSKKDIIFSILLSIKLYEFLINIFQLLYF